MVKLRKGLEVIVDYTATNRADVIEIYEDSSNLEGFDTIVSFDESYCELESGALVQLEYIAVWDEYNSEYTEDFEV